MADVRYILSVTIPTQSGVEVSTAMAAVNIQPVVEERARDFTICSDTTAIGPVGTVTRTIIANLSAEFELKFPTENDRIRALTGAFKNRFASMLPANVIESVNVGAFCP